MRILLSIEPLAINLLSLLNVTDFIGRVWPKIYLNSVFDILMSHILTILSLHPLTKYLLSKLNETDMTIPGWTNFFSYDHVDASHKIIVLSSDELAIIF